MLYYTPIIHPIRRRTADCDFSTNKCIFVFYFTSSFTTFAYSYTRSAQTTSTNSVTRELRRIIYVLWCNHPPPAKVIHKLNVSLPSHADSEEFHALYLNSSALLRSFSTHTVQAENVKEVFLRSLAQHY